MRSLAPFAAITAGGNKAINPALFSTFLSILDLPEFWNIALVKDALNHRDLKTTIAVDARTRKSAVIEAKESLHSSWVAKARQLDKPQDEEENS